MLDGEPDPVELVEFLSRRFAPPTLIDALGDPPRWIDFFDTDDLQRVRATLTLDGDTVLVETISERRLDGVLAVLRGIDPVLEVLDETRTPASDLKHAPREPAAAPDPDAAT